MSDDDDVSPLQAFLREAISEAGGTRDHYDRLIQQRRGTQGKPLWDIDRGKSRQPSRSMLNDIAEALGQPIALLVRAVDGERVRPVPAPSQLPDLPVVRDASAGEMVDIAQLDLSFSMGPGTEIDDYIEETQIRFDLGYIRSFTRTLPARLRIARGVGESMFPTLLSSDLIWIDTTQRILNQQDRIWAISLFGAAAIKRLRAIGGGRVLIISDNPGVENQEVSAEDLMIGGRVIRFTRDV